MRTIQDYTVEPITQVRQATAEGVRAFVAAKYGLSMHWGLYSINGRGEWVYYVERIPYDVYRPRMKEFNPYRFNAEEWADLMLESGQKVLTLTSKHHDGFCLWDTQLTDFKITNTPFKRDAIAELARALHDRGLSLHFYYSLLDWTHPAYRRDWPAYVAYYQGQLRELLTQYGPIGGILFDGYWPRQTCDNAVELDYFQPRGPWDLQGTYNLIHELQPNAVVANNAHVMPLPGEDYQIWELDFPGENSTGFNTSAIGTLPHSIWWNLNGGWAYAPRLHAVKIPAAILGSMSRAFSYGAVFNLNVGPRPFGDIHPEEQQALRDIGRQARALHMLG